jgi:hypothetical protein
MNDVKRYSQFNSGYSMWENCDGGYVEYADYAQRVQSLEAQLAAAEKEIKEMHELDIKITEAEWCRKYRDACIFISEQADRIDAAEKDTARMRDLLILARPHVPANAVDMRIIYTHPRGQCRLLPMIDAAIAAAKPATPGKLEGET